MVDEMKRGRGAVVIERGAEERGNKGWQTAGGVDFKQGW